MNEAKPPSHIHILLDRLLVSADESIGRRGRHAALSKHDCVRTKLWLTELKQGTSVPLWVRNRVHYAVLLLHAIDNGTFEQPLDKAPKQSPLPMLPRHTVARVKSLINQAPQSSLLFSVLEEFRDSSRAEMPADKQKPEQQSSNRSSSPRRLMFGLLCESIACLQCV